MLRSVFLILLSAASLAGEIRWKCDAKDGKFITALCANCKKFYCWDGQIFSEEEGYTPPPSYVLAYWEEVHRKSAQIRADIDRRGKELKEQVEKGREETARLNQERAQAHQEFMDNLNRRISESRSSAGVARNGVAANTQRVVPRDTVVTAPGPATPAPIIPPASRAKVNEVQVGMDRAAVEGVLGKPHSALDDGAVQVLSYTLEDHGAARVRIEEGRVVSVKMSD